MANIPIAIVCRIDDDCKLKTSNTQRWKLVMRHFKGKEVLLSFEEYSDQRTNDQNSLYWLYLQLIIDESGFDNVTTRDLHAYFKHKFIETKLITLFGETISAEKSTTGMSKKDFSAYLEKINLLTGIPIPDTEAYKRS